MKSSEPHKSKFPFIVVHSRPFCCFSQYKANYVFILSRHTCSSIHQSTALKIAARTTEKRRLKQLHHKRNTKPIGPIGTKCTKCSTYHRFLTRHLSTEQPTSQSSPSFAISVMVLLTFISIVFHNFPFVISRSIRILQIQMKCPEYLLCSPSKSSNRLSSPSLE